MTDDELLTIKPPELTPEDNERKSFFLEILREFKTDDMPPEIVDQLTVMGRPQLNKRNNGAEEDYRFAVVPFRETHLGDELAQIAAYEANKEAIKAAVFNGQSSLKVIFEGETYEITPDTLDKDIKYMIFGSDIGKAGDGPASREVVGRLFNNLNIGRDQMDWMKQNPEKFDEFAKDAKINTDPETMDAYRNSYKNGYFMDIPLSVALRMSVAFAESKNSGKEAASTLNIEDSEAELLKSLGFDAGRETTRAFFDAHIIWGQKLIDRLKPADSADGKRMRMLFQLGLTHHYSDYMPLSFKDGRLVLEGDSENLAVVQVLLDKADGFIKRSGKKGEEVKMKVFDNIEKGRMVKGKGATGESILKRCTEVGNKLDWNSIESSLRDGYRFIVHVPEAKKTVQIDAPAGTILSDPIRSAGVA